MCCPTEKSILEKGGPCIENSGKRGKLPGSHPGSDAEKWTGALDRRCALHRLFQAEHQPCRWPAARNGYVSIDQNGLLGLTESGMQIATSIYERHTVLTAFLTALGVDAETAAEDACRIEHVLSEETFDKLKQHAKAYIDAQGK